MPEALIGLGANEGDTKAALDRAMELLAATEQVTLVAKSGHRATAPIGGPLGQGEFQNAAVRVETSLGPQDLLRRLLDIEQLLGRRREVRWGPRTLDLDLLLYDRLTLAPEPSSEQPLELPHPRMEFRRFVLESAAEVAGDMLHAPTGWTISRLWRHLVEAPNVAALVGGAQATRVELASRLQETFGAGPSVWRIANDWESDRSSIEPAPKLLIAFANDRSFIRERREGPIAFLPASDFEAAYAEAEAALRAMS